MTTGRTDLVTFRTRAEDVAKALADEVQATWASLPACEEESAYAKLVAPSGEDLGVTIYFNRYSAQWVLGAFQPSTNEPLRRKHAPVEIKVNPERSDAAIAREIARRLLPMAREALAEALGEQAQTRAFKAQCDETRTLLIASLGGEDRRFFGHPVPPGGFTEASHRERTLVLDITQDDRLTRAEITWARDQTDIQFQRLPCDLAARILAECEAYSAALRDHNGK